MDYLQCVCEQAQLCPEENTKERRELFAKTADAKARICLYGSRESIEVFSTFEKLGAAMNNAEQRAAFTGMIAVMRTDSGNKIGVKAEDLQMVLLGRRGLT